MSRLFKPVFRGVDKKKLSDEAHIADYQSSPAVGRVTLGSLCLYYRDLGKKYWVPYDYIQRVYTKVETCAEDEFANNQEYYRLMLVHDGKDFANLIFAKQEEIQSIYAALKEKVPGLVIGRE